MKLTIPAITNYHTADKCELRDSVPVTEALVALMELTVGPLKKGDILSVLAEFQVTNDLHKPPYNTPPLSANVYITGTLRITKDQSQDFKITPPSGQNFDTRVHHFRFVTGGTFEAPVDFPANSKIVLWVKSGSTAAKPNWRLTVDKGKGSISVVKISPGYYEVPGAVVVL